MRRATLVPVGGLVLGGVLALLAFTGCTKHTATGGSQGTPASSASPPGATLAVAGQFISGEDASAIRAYLQSVKEVKPKKFDVEWNSDVVAFSREATMSSLRAISEDGSQYTLANSNPAVASLRPGKILWLYDIAVRRVTGTESVGDATVVDTEQMPLAEAFKRAQIEFDTPVSPPDYYMSFRPHLPPQAPTTPAKVSALRRHSPYVLVVDTPGSDQPPSPEGGQENTDPYYELDDYGAGTPVTGGYAGTIHGFVYSLGYKATTDALSLELIARKGGTIEEMQRDQRAEFWKLMNEQREEKNEEMKLEMLKDKLRLQIKEEQMEAAQNKGVPIITKAQLEAGKTLEEVKKELIAAKQKEADSASALKRLSMQRGQMLYEIWNMVTDNFDLRFRAKADIYKFNVSALMGATAGKFDSAQVTFKDLNGKLHYEFIGRVGEEGNGMVSVPVFHIPIIFNIPIPVYGVPFVVQLATDALVKVAVVGKFGTVHFEGDYGFNGSSGFQADKSKTEANSTLESKEPQFEHKEALSPGTSGVVAGLQLPRVGVGVGFLGANAVAFIDLVNVLTETNSAAVATLNPNCKKFTWTQVGNVGIDTSLMPLPFPLVTFVGNRLLTQKKEVLHHEKKWTDPDIPMCRI